VPIYEYACRQCHARFEAIVRLSAEDAVECPTCHGRDLEKLISTFAANSEGTRKMAIKAVQRSNARTTRDKAWSDFEYDRKHRHE
jgi:putative FmdB family regulatory protein